MIALREAACVALCAAVVGCDGRPRSSVVGGAASDDRRSGPSIAVLDAADGLPEQASAGWLGIASKGSSLEDLVRAVERLQGDKEVRGVLVRLGTARVGLGRAEEIGALLARLGAKIPVWCHADDYSNATLALAAQGCTRIWVSPATSVDAIGIAVQTVYFHKLLAEDLGLDVDFLQVGKFKGAEEPFTRDGPSAEARQSLESTLTGLRAAWLDDLRTPRPDVTEATAENGPYTANEAKSVRLVDDVGYFDEARDALKKATGAGRVEVRLGNGADDSPGDDFTDLLRVFGGDGLSSAPVVVVRAIGAISMGGGGIGGGEGIVEARLLGTLTRLEHDDDVKAVVLRIDSPGGSALASDLLWHALMRIRAKKTLVVSIGDMAASGGYYLASSGAVVFADAASIVGSIGVVGGKIAADHALEKWGVHAETFAANKDDPGAASRAAYDSLFVPWDDATKERVLATMTGIYDLFLSRVSTGRGIPVERVAESAEGRIFSGKDAKTRGLVDQIGGLVDAIVRARSLAGLPKDARIAVAGEPSGLLGALVDDGNGSARSPALVRALGRTSPDFVSFVDSVLPLVGDEHALCAMPFALTVH